MTPFGAVSSIVPADMFREITVKSRGTGYLGDLKEDAAERRRRERYMRKKRKKWGRQYKVYIITSFFAE